MTAEMVLNEERKKKKPPPQNYDTLLQAALPLSCGAGLGSCTLVPPPLHR